MLSAPAVNSATILRTGSVCRQGAVIDRLFIAVLLLALSVATTAVEIAVMYVAGDGESAHLATQIYAFLKANGFKMKEDGISQGVFSPPLHGLAFATDTNTFEVGSK